MTAPRAGCPAAVVAGHDCRPAAIDAAVMCNRVAGPQHRQPAAERVSNRSPAGTCSRAVSLRTPWATRRSQLA
jgi:hypothetical protein